MACVEKVDLSGKAFLTCLGSIIGSVERILLRFSRVEEVKCIDEILLLDLETVSFVVIRSTVIKI